MLPHCLLLVCVCAQHTDTLLREVQADSYEVSKDGRQCFLQACKNFNLHYLALPFFSGVRKQQDARRQRQVKEHEAQASRMHADAVPALPEVPREWTFRREEIGMLLECIIKA